MYHQRCICSPTIFTTLRIIIDGYRQKERKARHFLLLGSASIDLLRQSGESLAGRVSYLKLSPLNAQETIDLVVHSGKEGLWAIETKRGSVPKLSRGFHTACEDLKPARRFVVHGGRESFALGEGVEALNLRDMMTRFSEL